MQAVHAESPLAEMKEQLEADKAERANAVGKRDGALQSQRAAAQSVYNSNIALKAELVELQQRLAAESAQQSDLQRDLQRAEQQSISAAEVHERLVAAQQQLAAVTAERDEPQHEKQAWASQCEDLRTASKAKDGRIFLINMKIVAVDAVRRAYSEKAKQEEVAAGLQVQREQLQAETAELRCSSASQISHLLSNFKKIGAVHHVEAPSRVRTRMCRAPRLAFLQSRGAAVKPLWAVGPRLQPKEQLLLQLPKPHSISISKGEKFNNNGKVVGSGQHE